MSALSDLGITREDVVEKAAERLLEELSDTDESWIDSLKSRVLTAVTAKATTHIDAVLAETVSRLADTEFTPVDEWGDRKGKATTLREMIKTRALSYLTQKVDERGNPSTYHAAMSRATWLAQKAAEDAMTLEVKKELSNAVATAKDELRKQVAQFIADTLLKK